MLRVTVELVPHGHEEEKEVIGIASIVNDGSGTHELGNYVAFFLTHDSLWGQSIVKKFPREENVWELLYRALTVAKKNRENSPIR